MTGVYSPVSALVLAVCALVTAACGQASSNAAVPPERVPPASHGDRLQPPDLYHLRSIGEVQLSPDASRVAYTVVRSDRVGAPVSELRVMALGSLPSQSLEPPLGPVSTPRWSPDSRSIAFLGRQNDRYGLLVADIHGGPSRFVAPVQGTNHPLPSTGERIAWSPDGRQLAFVSAVPGPEGDAKGDPIVITRYLYKPAASNGEMRFNDNRRLHIFIADLERQAVRQITSGVYHEHSIAWSPSGDRIVFVSNRAADPDRVFNYDIFSVRVDDGSVAQLTHTRGAEYQPAWAADGVRIAFLATTRPLTSSETTMEDTHVWTMNADGTNVVEAGAAIDNRQGAPRWSSAGRATMYFTVQERGRRKLYRLSGTGEAAESVPVVSDSVGAWSLAYGSDRRTHIAYASTADKAPSDLYVRSGGAAPVRLTDLNREVLAGRSLAEVESFTYASVDGMQIEAFLTKPVGLDVTQRSAHPMIVIIHGGPHGQQGAGFDAKAQMYAAQGWASLMVNYRGSTGYGQKFADAIFADQNGAEAQDVLAGVDAALRRYPWIDAARLGIEGRSYGGQLTNWIITRTDRFRAAVPTASISNLVTQNYLSYYHDYLAVEFGGYPHEKGLIDMLWERSPIRYVNKVRTPTMFMHGENDNNVPIAEAEQFYIALKDVGVDTIMVRYPREGHSNRETKHVIDAIERSIDWYQRHFEGRHGVRPTT